MLQLSDITRVDWGKHNIIIAPPTSADASHLNVVLNGFSVSSQGDQFSDTGYLPYDDYGDMALSLMRNENEWGFKAEDDGVPPELLLENYGPREIWDCLRSTVRLSPEDSEGKYLQKTI